jgi:hypothetical protein
MNPKLAKRIARGLRRRALRLVPSRLFVPWQYALQNGRAPDLRAPKDLSEKLCWMKLHVRSELQARCSDKIAVRDYVTATIGADALVPLILTTKDADDVNPSTITAPRFVVKLNHDSGGVFVCDRRETFDWEGVRRRLRQRIRQNYFYEAREPGYRAIEPRIVVEEHLAGGSDVPILDYKFWTFHGRVELIQISRIVLGDQGIVESFHLFLDRAWKKLAIRKHKPLLDEVPPRPEALEALIEAAERLARPFPFCRVDLYRVEGRLRFGELTFFPSGGFVRFVPDEAERRLGDLLHLPDPVARPGRRGIVPAARHQSIGFRAN